MKPSVPSQTVYQYTDWFDKWYTGSKKPSTVPALIIILRYTSIILGAGISQYDTIDEH